MSAFAKSELPEKVAYQANSLPQKPRFLQSDPEFKRHDFQIYISNLPQRAGVPTEQIRQLVLKELVDNALDEMDRVGRPGQVEIVQEAENTYTVTDQGRCFDDTPLELAKRFSLDKEMTSSKQWRRPTRGCVGNGLRVIVGSVLSGVGRIIIKTRNQQVTLRPRLDGTTAVKDVQAIDWPIGAAVTIEIGSKYPDYGNALEWALLAIQLARHSSEPFVRNPSIWWLDRDHLALNMLSAIGPTYTLARFVDQLDRCKSRDIGQLVTQRFGKGRLCRDVNQAEAADLLKLLRDNIPAVIKPKQLGPMGADAWKHEQLTDGYACEQGTFNSGLHEPRAQIPFLVEVWAATCETPTDADFDDVYPVDIIGFTINRSPVTIESDSVREGRRRDVSVGLGEERLYINVPQGAFDFAINVTSPYVPIVSDNKSPSLNCFKEVIVKAAESAIRKSARNNPPTLILRKDDDDDHEDEEKPERIFQRDAIWQVLPEAIERSGAGGFEFSQRSLYYRVRILIKEIVPAEPTYNYFCSVLTDYENDTGEIEKLIRDTRGVYVEPQRFDSRAS
jgi:hypothetical protein